MRARYGEALHGAYDVAAVLALVDGYVAEIDEGARRDERKWSAAYRTYQDSRY